MKSPVVRVNPGIHNYQNLDTAFNSVVQSDSNTSFEFDHDYFENEIFALRSVEHHREKYHQDVAKFIEINEDLNKRLEALQQDYKTATTAEPPTPV